jgi:hypothetical protein
MIYLKQRRNGAKRTGIHCGLLIARDILALGAQNNPCVSHVYEGTCLHLSKKRSAGQKSDYQCITLHCIAYPVLQSSLIFPLVP